MAGDGDTVMVFPVILVDDNHVRHFHDPFFDALQVVAAAGYL